MNIKTLLLAALATALPAAAQTVLINDTFTLTETRVAGSVLNGANPESGYYAGNQWNATQSNTGTVFSSGGAIVASGNNASNEARIGIGSATGIMTVSASLVTSTANWVAIGFTSDTTTGLFTTSGVGLLWVALTPGGTMTVYQNGTGSVQSKSWSSTFESTLGAYSNTTAYTVSLSYNTATNKAYVTVSNGTATTSLVTGGGTSPDGWFPVSVTASSIAAAGFRINGQSGTTAGAVSIDNFSVTTTSGIPEPAGFATLAGLATLAGMFVMRRGAARRA